MHLKLRFLTNSLAINKAFITLHPFNDGKTEFLLLFIHYRDFEYFYKTQNTGEKRRSCAVSSKWRLKSFKLIN